MAVTGYTRQAAANISTGLTINAADHNAEYNQIQSAFDNAAGHDHSGAVSGAGQKITLTSSVTGVLPVANGGTGVTTSTGTTSVVLSGNPTINSPTITTPTISGDTSVTTANAGGGRILNVTNSSTTASTYAQTNWATGTAGASLAAYVQELAPPQAVIIAGTGCTGGFFITTSTGLGVNVFGTSTTNSAPAGYVGEFISATAATYVVSLSSAVATNVASIALSAGDWDVWGSMSFAGVLSSAAVAITTTSATYPSFPNGGGAAQIQMTSAIINSPTLFCQTRVSLAGSTTVYLVGVSVAGSTAGGFIGARRRR